jgi:hypothetical protein
MATIPIGELVKTVELVRTMKETLDTLTDVVERLGERVESLEKTVADFTGSSGRP